MCSLLLLSAQIYLYILGVLSQFNTFDIDMFAEDHTILLTLPNIL